MYSRYCAICGDKFDSKDANIFCCSNECHKVYGDQQIEAAIKKLENAAPLALEILGYENIEEYARHKYLVDSGNSGSVYFIQQGNDGLIKIGTTENVKARLATLQTSSPHKLNLLNTISGGRQKEAELHNRFSEFRKNGEWFEPVQELLDFIYALKSSENEQ